MNNNPKRIPLTQGKFAIVDAEDYTRLSKHKWCARKGHNTYYAVRAYYRGKQYLVYMHREILGLVKGDGKQTDHRNNNGLDNRETNIRICTNQQNSHNQRPHKNTTSKFKGVGWYKRDRNWRSQIMHNYQLIHIGYFDNEIEAAMAYDKKAKELFGEFASCNF